MKKLFITIGILFGLFFLTTAQTSNRAVNISLDPKNTMVYDSMFYANDWRVEWYKKAKEWYVSKNIVFDLGKDWMSKMLIVGNQMPDLLLGEANDLEGKEKFSDLRGKIVILDFWNTTCATCIEAFPKMEALQRKFGNKIQIVLVNNWETEEEITKRMGQNIRKLPNLPSIVNARHLFPYFPTYMVPYHVWIDRNSIIQVIGSMSNTYEKKIQDLIDGKPITALKTSALAPNFKPSVPYFKLISHHIDPKVYNSFFTPFNYNYSLDQSVYKASNEIDPVNGNIRNTYINYKVKGLYEDVFKPWLKQDKKIIINPYLNSVCYEVKDSLRYESNFLDPLYLTDTAYAKGRFCYEQVYPKEVSDKQARNLMLEDLNNYFGKLYGTCGRMEKRIVPCYIIIRVHGKGIKAIRFGGETSFHGLIDASINRDEFYKNKVFLIDGTGINGNVSMKLPENASVQELKLALKPYGLDIIKENTEIELLVISDTKVK